MVNYKTQCAYILTEVTYARVLNSSTSAVRQVERQHQEPSAVHNLLSLIKTRLVKEANGKETRPKDHVHDLDPLLTLLCASPKREDLYTRILKIINQADQMYWKRLHKQHLTPAKAPRSIFDRAVVLVPIRYVSGVLVSYLHKKALFKIDRKRVRHADGLDEDFSTFLFDNDFAGYVEHKSHMIQTKFGCLNRKGTLTALSMLNYLLMPCNPYTFSGLLRSPGEIDDARHHLAFKARQYVLGIGE